MATLREAATGGPPAVGTVQQKVFFQNIRFHTACQYMHYKRHPFEQLAQVPLVLIRENQNGA